MTNYYARNKYQQLKKRNDKKGKWLKILTVLTLVLAVTVTLGAVLIRDSISDSFTNFRKEDTNSVFLLVEEEEKEINFSNIFLEVDSQIYNYEEYENETIVKQNKTYLDTNTKQMWDKSETNVKILDQEENLVDSSFYNVLSNRNQKLSNIIFENKEGTFKINYQIEVKFLEETKISFDVEEEIEAILVLSPTINLVDDNLKVIDLSYGEFEYEEKGAIATDHFGANLNIDTIGEVKKDEGIYLIEYVAVDFLGNESRKQRIVLVYDSIANKDQEPFIILNGEENITLYKSLVNGYFDEYEEKGAIAISSYGELLDVDVIGEIDQEEGTYELTYKATDKFGNVSTITRNIEVVEISGKGLIIPSNFPWYIEVDYESENFPSSIEEIVEGYDFNVYDFKFEKTQWEIDEIKDQNWNTIEEIDFTIDYQRRYYTLVFNFYDKYGNTENVYIDVRFRFYEPEPDIELINPDQIVSVGEEYEEPGIIAIDFEGNELDYKVIQNSVDTSTPGTYLVRYEVESNYSNYFYYVRWVQVAESISEMIQEDVTTYNLKEYFNYEEIKRFDLQLYESTGFSYLLDEDGYFTHIRFFRNEQVEENFEEVLYLSPLERNMKNRFNYEEVPNDVYTNGIYVIYSENFEEVLDVYIVSEIVVDTNIEETYITMIATNTKDLEDTIEFALIIEKEQIE